MKLGAVSPLSVLVVLLTDPRQERRTTALSSFSFGSGGSAVFAAEGRGRGRIKASSAVGVGGAGRGGGAFGFALPCLASAANAAPSSSVILDRSSRTCTTDAANGVQGGSSSSSTALRMVASSSSASSDSKEAAATSANDEVMAAAAQSAEQEPGPRNRNVYSSGAYDRPVVLVGCSGPGNELRRLAESLGNDLGGGGDGGGRANVIVLDVASESRLGKGGGGIKGLAEEISGMDRSTVVVLDFGDGADRPGMTELARSLLLSSEGEGDGATGLLGVYVNVHPVHGRLSEEAAAVRRELEDEFVRWTEYEVCVKNEGLLSSEDNAAVNGREEEEGGEALAAAAVAEDGSDFVAPDGWDGVTWELSRLVARSSLPPAVPGETYTANQLNVADINMGKHTFFLSLSFPHVREASPYLEAMCQDVDAMEYRADLIAERDDRFELSYQLQTLRRMCRPHAVRAPRLPLPGRAGTVIEDGMPVVFTVRTAHQAGTYPDDEEGIRRMFGMLEVGLRSGVEVLDVESAWDDGLTDALLRLAEERYATQILGSHHVVGRESSMEEAVGFYRQCHLGGRAHGAKVVLSVDDDSKDAMALDAGLIAQSLCASSVPPQPVVPNVALLLGEAGQYSRILNERFTPVTHESLPFVAAPGQLTANEIMATRLVMGVLKPRKFGILGHNIAYSVSPAMHGAAFAAAKLPHSYSLLDMENVEELIKSDFWNDEDFGGLSVTIPHKQNIMPYMDELSDSVKAIGAMNTVVVEKDEDTGKRRLVGDNTDWRGIHGPLERRLGGSEGKDGRGAALILGGGGTARAAAYAARELGLFPIHWNRTPGKARELAEAFGGAAVETLDEDCRGDDGTTCLGEALAEASGVEGTVPVAVISTLPAAAGFVLPQWLVDRSSASSDDNAGAAGKPVVFDVNYKPYSTPLLEQAEGMGCQVIRGSEMLWEQGVGQFELWTGRTAPYGVMRAVVLDNCLPKTEE